MSSHYISLRQFLKTLKSRLFPESYWFNWYEMGACHGLLFLLVKLILSPNVQLLFRTRIVQQNMDRGKGRDRYGRDCGSRMGRMQGTTERAKGLKDLCQDGVTERMAVPFAEMEKPGEGASLRKKSSIWEIVWNARNKLCATERAELKWQFWITDALGDVDSSTRECGKKGEGPRNLEECWGEKDKERTPPKGSHIVELKSSSLHPSFRPALWYTGSYYLDIRVLDWHCCRLIQESCPPFQTSTMAEL